MILPRAFDHRPRTYRLDSGAYLVEWPPDAEGVPGGDAVVVDVDLATTTWLEIADVAIRRGGHGGAWPIVAMYPDARNALVVVTELGGEQWLLQVRSDRRAASALPTCRVVRAARTDGLLLGALAYRWLLGGEPPAGLVRATAVLTAERETWRGPA
jgi:hypothetical protein